MRFVITIALLACGVLIAPAPASADTPRIQVLQANICGAMDHCDAKGRQGKAIPSLIDRIADNKYDLVTLVEVCDSQYEAIISGLKARGWEMTGGFAVAQDPESKCVEGKHQFGNAILSKGAVLSTFAQALARPTIDVDVDSGGETRQLLCIDTALRDKVVKACATHLSSNEDRAKTQARHIAGLLNEAAKHMPVIIGGDFNLRPDAAAMGTLYTHSEGRGRFIEIDEKHEWQCPFQSRCRSGEFTAGSPKHDKYDYVFASEDHFKDPYAKTLKTTYSDHYFLSGSFRPRW